MFDWKGWKAWVGLFKQMGQNSVVRNRATNDLCDTIVLSFREFEIIFLQESNQRPTVPIMSVYSSSAVTV